MDNIKEGNVVVIKTYNENNSEKNRPPYMVIDKILDNERIEVVWYESGDLKRMELSANAVMLWKKYS